jgi:lactoylglutathione lyase
MPNVKLTLLVLKTRQIEALKAFYGSLGIELIEEQHGKGPIHYSGQVGDGILEIYPLSDDTLVADETTRLGFSVEGMDQVVHELRACDTPIVSEPKATQWGLRSVVRDPDGRSVELYGR